MTLDVSSLYTNIPHNDGIDAYLYYLQHNNNSSKHYKDELICILRLMLDNNFFQLGDNYYLTKTGTAIGILVITRITISTSFSSAVLSNSRDNARKQTFYDTLSIQVKQIKR